MALPRPRAFNFAHDVVDAQPRDAQAMFWVSADGTRQRQLSYGYFASRSRRVASWLLELGLRRGDVVLLVLPRWVEWWEIAVAALRAGIVLCPATTLLVDKDLAFRCQQTRARVFIGDEVGVAKVRRVRDQCPDLETVVCVREEGEGRATTAGGEEDGVLDFREAVEKSSSVWDDGEGRRTGPEDPALIFFTSGTSGPPKMVRHSQISYPLAHKITGKHWLQLEPGKLYWNLSEQGWAKAAWSFFGTWNCGASLFIHDDRRAFSATRLLDNLHKYPITTLCAPPTAYRQLVLQENQKYLKAHPPRALEHCTGAGEPLNDSVVETWQQMTGLPIHDGYGQTETIMVCGNFRGMKIKPGSMGKPSPGVPLFVIDADGKECPPGVEGDIAILRSSDSFFGIFDGYLSPNGELDRRIKILGGRPWYLTGDRATRDEEGYFWFVGRSDDVINSSGYRIGPFEVESTLKLHPAVVESAVVASPDANRGEVVKAFIVLTSQYSAKTHSEAEIASLTREIQEFCKAHAAPYKYPRKIEFVGADFLPKTISGKIKRAELKALERNRGGAAGSQGRGAKL